MLGRIGRFWVESRPSPRAGLIGAGQACTFSVRSCPVLPGCLQFPGAPLPQALVPGTRQEVAWFLCSGGQVSRGWQRAS